MKKRIFLYIAIVLICLVAVGVGIYYVITAPQKEEGSTLTVEEQAKYDELSENFKNLFNNAFNTNESDEGKAIKIDTSKELIYTAYTNKDKVDNKYELNVNIPVINITGSVAAEMNAQTQKIFADKTSAILSGTTERTIYSVEYAGYMNGDILSLVIRSTLKEGNNAQRVIVQTYNYNMKTNSKVSFNDLLAQKGISQDVAKRRIIEEAEKANQKNEAARKLGYTVYLRNLADTLYLPENTTTYFLGPDNYIYAIYAYGNNNYTSEMDVVVF